MAVQFILGRSGTGKTSYCVKAIVDALSKSADGQPLILLVPEQATYQAERAILTDERIAGYNRLNVLSFDRLQFLLSGKNTARPALSRIGRQMIIHRILREAGGKLKIFHPSANQPGLARQMAETITELHQYAKMPADIDKLLNELQKDERNNLAVLKFADIGLILKEYLEFIEGKFVDPDIQLSIARRVVTEAGFVRGARLWVDGFAGFTTAELAMLAELLKVAADVQIALCLDPSEINLTNPDAKNIEPVSLFSPTQRTYTALIELIKKCKLQLAEPIVLERAVRFSRCPQLGHIERNVFKLETQRITTADNIQIISAPNARAEVQFVAREILQLVRQRNLRYRDIAVIASDIESYQHYVRAYFDDYAIPFFIDKRKPLNQYPVVGLICSALQVVTGGFSHSDIFAYLKTDLVPLKRCDADLLENYCLAFGISGTDWQNEKDWHFAGREEDRFDEQCINQIRRKVGEPLLEIRDKLCPAGNTAGVVSAEKFKQVIFDFLESLQVFEKIDGWIEEAGERKDYATVDEHRQFYDKLINIFDELVEVFAGREMSCQDYLAIVNSAFSQLTLAFIPPTLDQVLVGSIERSRHPDLKAVFLIGTTQKHFPVPVNYNSLLTDDDKSAAESADFELAATTTQKLTERQYLAYIAFTRACQFLYVTYPSADDKGSAIVRSQFIDNLEALFENLNEKSIAGEQIEIENVHSEIELLDLLCSRCGKDTSQYSVDDIILDEQLGELGTTVLSAINYDNRAWLEKEVVGKLFGEQIESSATKLSTFAACPYRYFARYTLELKERGEFKFEPLDLGVFYHCVLDALLKRLNAEKKDFAAIEDKELLGLLREQILKFVKEDSFISNFVRHKKHNEFIIHSAGEILEDCVLGIAQMVRAGAFKPTLSEVWFGKAGDRLTEYKIALHDGRVLSLKGKIDRLDIADINGRKAAIVFDYKRKGKSFSWSEFYYGLDMQLPVYMLAVRNTDCKPVGAFYMPVELAPGVTGAGSRKAKGIFNGEFYHQLDKKASKDSEFYNFYVTKDDEPYGNYGRSGALKPSDFERVLQFTEEKIVRLAEEILSGEIDVRPYRLSQKSPCSYCEYKPLCRFDWQINDYQSLGALSKLDVLEKTD